MTKLSNAQVAVIEQAKKDIDKARNLSFEDWCKTFCRYEMYLSEYLESEWWLNRYNKDKAGTVLVSDVNSRTLIKLEQLGMIKIVYDSNGTHSGIDEITLLNY